MKLGQLKRKVAKEFAKSPAKTITLIALCPLSLYFIVPLLLPKKTEVDEAQKIKVITPNSVPTRTLATSTAQALPVSVGPTWEQLIRWINADVRRKSGTIAADQRNPFQAPPVKVPEIVEVIEPPPEVVVAPPRFTQKKFDALGLKLSGTMVGRHSRSATINGKQYVEGAKISPSAGHIFVLKHVGARLAIFEMDGQQFRLNLDAPKGLGKGITVLRRTSSPN